MPTGTFIEGAAASAIGSDLLDGKQMQSARVYRAIRYVGLVGSTAIADAQIEIFYGDKFMGNFYNTTAGAAKIATAEVDLIPMGQGLLCPPGVDMHAFIKTAGTGQVLALTLVVDEIKTKQRY